MGKLFFEDEDNPASFTGMAKSHHQQSIAVILNERITIVKI